MDPAATNVVHAKFDEARHWIGSGKEVGGLLTDEEVLTEGNLDWKVSLEPTYIKRDVGFGEVATIEVPKNNAVVRSDTGDILGVVGDWYEPFQNEEFVAFGSALTAQHEVDAKWDLVGTRRGGAEVFASLRVGGGVEIAGHDPLQTYLLLRNSHDGSSSLQGTVLTRRLACENQVAGALVGVGKVPQSFTIRHTGSLTQRLASVRETIGLTLNYEAAFARIADELAATETTLSEVDEFLAELFPIDPEAGERAKTNALERRGGVRHNLRTSPTIPDDLRGTRWGAYNAVTEWAEWKRPARARRGVDPVERHFGLVLDGPVATVRNRALKLLTA